MSDTAEINIRIEKVLERFRPFLKEDDGDIEFIKYDPEKRFAYVKLLGNCKGCPLSNMTLQAGILRALNNEISEIERIMEVK